MTTTRFTKEQLIKRLEEQQSGARYALSFVQDSEILRDIEMDLRITEIALASLEAEPVLYAAEETLAYARQGELHLTCLSEPMGDAVIPLFAAPPAPVVSGEYGDAYQGAREDLAIWKRRALEAEKEVQRLSDINDYLVKEAQGESRMGEPVIREPAPVVPDAYVRDERGRMMLNEVCEPRIGFGAGWNACRAAMLQGQPVSNRDELPLNYLQGHKDGLEWAAQMAEANHPQTGDWLYDDPIELAKAIRKGPDMPEGGNSPVIPDGWIPFIERPPENKPGSYEYIVFETLNNRAYHDYWNVPDKGDDEFTPFWNHYDGYVTHWMPLPAAPQQEVK